MTRPEPREDVARRARRRVASSDGFSVCAAPSASARDQRLVAAGLAWVCSLCQYHGGAADQTAAFSAESSLNWLRIEALPSGVTCARKPRLRCSARTSGDQSLARG